MLRSVHWQAETAKFSSLTLENLVPAARRRPAKVSFSISTGLASTSGSCYNCHMRTEANMPRPILGNRQNQQAGGGLSLERKREARTASRQMSKLELAWPAKMPRSRIYGGHEMLDIDVMTGGCQR